MVSEFIYESFVIVISFLDIASNAPKTLKRLRPAEDFMKTRANDQTLPR